MRAEAEGATDPPTTDYAREDAEELMERERLNAMRWGLLCGGCASCETGFDNAELGICSYLHQPMVLSSPPVCDYDFWEDKR